MNVPSGNLLCKWRGVLVLMRARPRTDGQNGHCPECGCRDFRQAPYGWIECCGEGCGFAALASDCEDLMDAAGRGELTNQPMGEAE